MNEGWTGADTTRIVQSYQDKLKEAVEWIKKLQYHEHGNDEYYCFYCGAEDNGKCQSYCKLNNFIKDNQGE